MALIVLDESSVAVSKAPQNGFLLKLSQITGFPEGLDLMIPFEGDFAVTVYDAIGEALGLKPKVETADLSTMRQEVQGGGTSGQTA